MNEIWENLYKTAYELANQIDVDGMTDTAEQAYQNFSAALDALIEHKNAEAFKNE